MQTRIRPERWGLRASRTGELTIGNHGVLSFAKTFGTPLHILDERRLFNTARKFLAEVTAAYPASVSVHYALKCNSVPAVVEATRSAGLSAEVMTEYELELALRLGFTGEHIIVNGPCKTDGFFVKCLRNKVRLIVIDSLEELAALDSLSRLLQTQADVLLRVNPAYRPRHLNRGTATSSRNCAFGLDMKGGEVRIAIEKLQTMQSLNFVGFHIHIGTGIRDPQDYVQALRRLKPAIDQAFDLRMPIRILDVGGGFASATSREYTAFEMTAYQAFNRLPEQRTEDAVCIGDFARAISEQVQVCFAGHELPELLCEPGRCIASANQFLLLTVHRTKRREGVGTWLITDGGLSTVTLPTYYEQHEVFLCNDVNRPLAERVNLIGPACFAGDIIYKNKLMPRIHPGEVIAIMDSGAYFTALESSFGFPRPAILSVNGAECRIIRARETFSDMSSRDIFNEEYNYEIWSHEEHIFSFVG